MCELVSESIHRLFFYKKYELSLKLIPFSNFTVLRVQAGHDGFNPSTQLTEQAVLCEFQAIQVYTMSSQTT